ncbi:alpha/beta hydrolase family protein [Streptantibioticus silvisoli]|uniref:Alpha/beta fold hydrolase n=1 Tax=Streptantibioticus silvisoli TaxID=2705255 RepID=A0ABT6WAX6_9ACTN|nr:alpha/beta fold hydrolase [Streptantibioticus silvisoli]MDI5967628.1 alpha/beta fold hydrolase [Streptantibioticus silvisoli]
MNAVDPPAADPHPSRRRALARLAAGAGALAAPALLSGCTGATASTAAVARTARPSPSGSGPGTAASGAAPGAMRLFDDPDVNFQALFALGSAGQHSSDVGEVLSAVNTINKAGPSNQSYTATFNSWGDRLTSQATQAGADGDQRTQCRRALRASSYYEQALYFVLGSDDPGSEKAVYLAFRQAWDVFAKNCSPAADLVSVRYGSTAMPVWFFRPDTSSRRRPTLILTNGSDGQNTDMWTYGVAAALDRGWNAVVYNGPGQGELLFVGEVAMTTRWENVVRPIVDYLFTRDDVDHGRVAISGFSLGGQLAPRAAAFDSRLAAVVAAPGCLSLWSAFPPQIRQILGPTKAGTNSTWNKDVVPHLSAADRFTLNKRFELYDPAVLRAARQGRIFTDFWTPARVISGLDITKVVQRIKAPTLVVDFEFEQFFPGQARKLYDLLRCPKHYVEMTRAQGAQLHCSPMAPQYYCEVVLDWLDRTLHT